MSALRAAALAALAALAPACASSLRAELDAHPDGAFGEAAARRAPTAAIAAPPVAEPVAVPPAAPDAPPEAAEPVRRGPVTAEDLAAAGVAVTPAALAPFRAAWDAGAGALDRGDARLAFLARSPAVSEAAQRYRAAFERYGQVAALDDLVRQYDAFARGLDTGAGTPIVKPDLAKRFPLGGVASIQGELVAVDVTAARVTLERDVLAALADFEAAFQEVYYWQRAAGILARVHDLAERVLDAARARYRAGSASHANLIQAEIREEALRVRLATAYARRGAARAALAAALALPSDALDSTSLHLDGLPPRPEKAAAAAAALAHGPAVAAARVAAARATLLVQLAEREMLPNLGAGSAVPGLGERMPAKDLMVATGGPFLREMQVRAEAAADALADAERRAPARAEGAWVTLDDARRRYASAAGHQLARAEQGVEVAEQGYRAGTATFFDLDSAVQLYLGAALDARAALRDAWVAAALLDAVVGTGPADAAQPQETP